MAVNPLAQAGANAAAQIARPAIFGTGQDEANAFKDGEFMPSKVHDKIFEGINAFTWAAQQLGDTKSTPKSKKNTEIPDLFKKSAADLKQYATRLKLLIDTLTPDKRKHKLDYDLTLLTRQYEILTVLATCHEKMTSPKTNINSALSSGKAYKIADSAIKIMQNSNAEDRQRALEIIRALKDTNAEPVKKHIDSKKSVLEPAKEFLKSASLQAITGKMRVQEQNPQMAL